MRRLKALTASFAVAALLLSLQACKKTEATATANPETVDSVKQKVKEALQAAKNYTYDHKDEYAQKLQNVVDDVNAKIADLKARAEKAGAEAQAQLQPQIDELRQKGREVQRQLDKVQAATPAAWSEIKTRVSKALEDLQDAFEKAKEKFK